MKKIFVLAALAIFAINLNAAPKKEKKPAEGFVFTTVKANPVTSVKNQNKSGTCWAFSSLGFFEDELLRMGKGQYDLGEMFLVHKTMEDRAEASVRMHGDISFSPGGSFYDAVYCFKNYGMIPQSAMPQPGTLYGDTLPNHGELDKAAGAYVESIAKSGTKKLSPIWKNALVSIYDNYLGKCPETFMYKGVEYTPKSFAASLGLNMDDYVSLTSFSHHPFYEQFVIEVQDNWRWGQSYNLPINELMEVFDNAINNSYTFAWGADVSEMGFTREGVAVCPDMTVKTLGSDMARWTGAKDVDKRKEMTSKPLPEINVTQEMRQAGYDQWETTDDHGMIIYGIAKDQNGKEYYMVKNSWGTDNKYKGTWYASKTFAKYKTINILIHKNAIPSAIAKKLGL